MTYIISHFYKKRRKKVALVDFHQNPEKVSQFPTLITISNVSWAVSQHIRVISEGSCDTEDWSNDAENSALITGINSIFTYLKFLYIV